MSTRRHLIDNRDVQIPIERQRQCSWNRGRGHDEYVRYWRGRGTLLLRPICRLCFVTERRALHHTEPVLFVNDNEPESVKIDTLLYQRLCSNDEICGAIGNCRQCLFALWFWQVTFEKHNVYVLVTGLPSIHAQILEHL